MPKPKWNLNTIYISERLQESLRPISRCAMNTVVAPLGRVKDNGQINMALCCDFRCGTSYHVTSILSLTLVVRCDSKNSTGLDK